MKSLLFIAAFAVGLLAFLVATQPLSAARGWWSWPNSGYCPSGTCNKLGGWKAKSRTVAPQTVSGISIGPNRRPGLIRTL
jgi:hypothetical protein